MSPKNQDRVTKIMDELKNQGYSTDNRTLTAVLHVMREEGMLPKSDDKEILLLIKKVVPKGGKILHIRGDNNERK